MERCCIILLAVLFVLLNVLDVVTTKRALARGAREFNPLVRWLMKWRLFLPVKVAVVLFVTGIILSAETTTALAVGALLCLLYGAVVAFNIRTLVRMKS